MFKVYRESKFASIEAILCTWLLLFSLAIPKAGLAYFLPELWKPIFPFQLIEPSYGLIQAAIWLWRLSLVSCLIWPVKRLPLFAASLTSFFCLGLCNCFWLEIQMFSCLQLVMFFLLFFSVLQNSSSEKKDYSSELAFSVKLVLVLLYFSAGLAKIRFGGLEWAFSENIQKYMQALLPTNRDIFGIPVILKLREQILLSKNLVAVGMAIVHTIELLMPLALFSKFFSRFFGWFLLFFTLSSFVAFGINFLSVLPLIAIWLIWDYRIQDFNFFQKPLKKSFIALASLVLLQVYTTLFSPKNIWPIMINDMYAKPYTYPKFDNLQIQITNIIGHSKELTGSEIYNPLLKMHIFVFLFRMQSEEIKTGFMTKLFEHYQKRLCQNYCEDNIQMKAVLILNGRETVVAETPRATQL